MNILLAGREKSVLGRMIPVLTVDQFKDTNCEQLNTCVSKHLHVLSPLVAGVIATFELQGKKQTQKD